MTLIYIYISLISINAKAQDYFDNKITPNEQAVFAFFRAAGVAPDYDFWIKSNSTYDSLGEREQERYLIKEMLRLGSGYGMYDLDTDLLEITTNIIVRYTEAIEEKPAVLSFRFFNLGNGETPTFNYPFGSEEVSMIVENIDTFSSLELTPEQDKAVREKIPYINDEFDAQLDISVRISNADYKTPIAIQGHKVRWLMAGKIAYIKCVVSSFYTQQSYTLWDYIAPWYEEQFRIKNMPKEEEYPHPYDLFK